MPNATGRAPAPDRRGRRHVAPAGVVVAYLAAGGLVLALRGRVAGAGWLALHLVMLGAVTNAIVVWSEHFAAALLHTRPLGARAATARLVALNLGVLAVLAGVRGGRVAVLAGGVGLLAAVVLLHALALARQARGALPTRLGDTVWFYVAAATALVAASGLGLLLAGGGARTGDAYRAIRLAHAHLNLLGWVGLAVIGTQFTLWPTVLRTRMVPGVQAAARRAFLLLVSGLGLAVAGLLAERRPLLVAGLAGYAAGLGVALGPFLRTLRQRRPRDAASWMLAAGMGWLAVSVGADLAAALGADPVVELDTRLAHLVPVLAAGFGLQVLAGALTYLLPAVWGRGAHGNRRLSAILGLAWPVRVAALNLGVATVAVAPAGGWAARAGWLLVGLALGAFAALALAALAWRLGQREVSGRRSARR
jgi:nitrite reductase (NO-forming)